MLNYQSLYYQSDAIPEYSNTAVSEIVSTCFYHKQKPVKAQAVVELVRLQPTLRSLRKAGNIAVDAFTGTWLKGAEINSLLGPGKIYSVDTYGFRHNLEFMLKKNRAGTRIELQTRHRLHARHILEQISEVSDQCDLLWLTLQPECLAKNEMKDLARSNPGAILECYIDFLYPLLVSVPEKAKTILDIYSEWGINRFALSWTLESSRNMSAVLIDSGFDITFYDMPDADAFAQGLLLLPRSIVL